MARGALDMNSADVIDFKDLLGALLDVDNPLPPRFLYRLSDIEQSELNFLAEIWSEIPVWRRRALMEDIEDLSKTDLMLSFETLGAFATQDEDPQVRLHAVQSLWEFENRVLIPLFVRLTHEDPDDEIRAAAAAALGQYVFLGELEELPSKALKEIEDLLLSVAQGKDQPNVRRSALESLGYSSREQVPALIETAYKSNDKEWIASALFAMGRSGNEVWEKPVLAMLENSQPTLRLEAARAAGELELSDATPQLLDLLDDPSDSIRFASIWSLSQIGGEGVREILEKLNNDSEHEDELDLLESALDNLAFTEGMQLMPMVDFPEYEEESEFEEHPLDEFGEFPTDEDEEDQEG